MDFVRVLPTNRTFFLRHIIVQVCDKNSVLNAYMEFVQWTQEQQDMYMHLSYTLFLTLPAAAGPMAFRNKKTLFSQKTSLAWQRGGKCELAAYSLRTLNDTEIFRMQKIYRDPLHPKVSHTIQSTYTLDI
jgi:hypothetical protein